MKITLKNGSDFRPSEGPYSTTTVVELSPDSGLGRIPANVVLLIDSSSSMSGSKWKLVKESTLQIIDSLKDEDRVGVVLFGSKAQEVFPLATLAENRKTMKEQISKLADPSGVTNLKHGLEKAFGAFDARSAKDKSKRVNHVILLTDGFPTDDQGYKIEKTFPYEEIVKQHEAISLTGIGIGSADEYDATFIARLSDLGRGSYYHSNDLEKFKAGMATEVQKLESSVVGDLRLRLSIKNGKIMRVAKVTPEIVLYDPPGGSKTFEIAAGSMTKDLTSFLIQTSTEASGGGTELPLWSLEVVYDGKTSETAECKLKINDNAAELRNIDADVLQATQMLQVHLNGEQIRLSLEAGDKAKATKLIANTTKIASSLGQNNVTRALTKLASDVNSGKSVSDNLATIQDESKKTRLLIKKS